MTNYLVDEYPLLVMPSLAASIGLNEAIILQQVHYWIKNKSQHRADRKRRDGRYWIYNSYPEWRKQFPFWSEITISRTVKALERQGLLLSEQRQSTNRSKWYTIDYDRLQAIVNEIEAADEAEAEPPILSN